MTDIDPDSVFLIDINPLGKCWWCGGPTWTEEEHKRFGETSLPPVFCCVGHRKLWTIKIKKFGRQGKHRGKA